MAKKMHVRAGDNVTVLSGKDKGKHGKVLEVNPDKGTVLVEGINMATKHVKPRNMNQPGGIIHQEAFINASNVMLICSKCKKPARTGRQVEESGRKVRVCRKCGAVIDVIKEAAKEAGGRLYQMARLKDAYKENVIPAMMEKFKYNNVNQVPRLEKIVVNMGVGEAKDNPKAIESAVKDMTIITGQKPVVTIAKKSVANFKLRAGMKIGCKVTLRGERMYEFADRFMNIALPRVRDFRGVSADSFDGRGNYSVGVKEQLIFPEIVYDDVDAIRGMNVCFVTTAKTDEEARELLDYMGMPIKKA